jgi:hypothetical protein
MGVGKTFDSGRHPASGTALRLEVDNVIGFALLFERHELPQRFSEKTFSGFQSIPNIGNLPSSKFNYHHHWQNYLGQFPLQFVTTRQTFVVTCRSINSVTTGYNFARPCERGESITICT